jgi:hypothetical protein
VEVISVIILRMLKTTVKRFCRREETKDKARVEGEVSVGGLVRDRNTGRRMSHTLYQKVEPSLSHKWERQARKKEKRMSDQCMNTFATYQLAPIQFHRIHMEIDITSNEHQSIRVMHTRLSIPADLTAGFLVIRPKIL